MQSYIQVVVVPQPYRVENHVPVANYIKEEYPVVVAQSLHPRIVKGKEVLAVEVEEFVPRVVEVEVQVPKLFDLPIRSRGVIDEWHRKVDVPSAQYNSMIKWLNPHLDMNDQKLQENIPWQRVNNSIPELAGPVAWAQLPPNTPLVSRQPPFSQEPRYPQDIRYQADTRYQADRHVTETNGPHSGSRYPSNYVSNNLSVRSFGFAPNLLLPQSQPIGFPCYQSGPSSRAHVVTHTAHPEIRPTGPSDPPRHKSRKSRK